MQVEANIFCDGHDVIRALLCHRRAGEVDWQEAPMRPLGNDRWQASFGVDAVGAWEYTLIAWIDRFLTWRHDLARREDEKDIAVAMLVGADLVEAAAARAMGDAGSRLLDHTARLRSATGAAACRDAGMDEELAGLMATHGERHHASWYDKVLSVTVDPERARFSAWYELFPRSCLADGADHGTFAECEQRLPYIAEMGFDVLYLPPIHPIGDAFRKGPNNALTVTAGDPGSPWAIGAADGATRRCTPSSARWTISAAWCCARASTASRWRWTSPSSARRTTPTCASIRPGSAGGRTAPCSTPRIRRRSTRTSTPSTSRTTSGTSSGWS
ncbi:MAG: DUF3416 domain-containing protein [Rhodocyclaceae bacterium]|nr:DUF3416 domain-containing protein [Rhodocyclaceae bacterium]